MHSILIIAFFLITNVSYAAESVVELPKAQFTGASTFETLNQDTYVPNIDTKLSGDRSTTVDELKWENPYPIENYGFPGGPSGVSVGGRSIEDTQVTTLGVPINLPQGGGADFSIFPSFLWDHVTISPVTSGSGFAPSASSGHVDFSPWTREEVLNRKSLDYASRVGVAYDHDAQTYSVGARSGDYAVLIGSTTGEISGQLPGHLSAGEASAVLYRGDRGHVIADVFSASERSISPGSITFPTPGADLKVWRVIPVIESSFQVASNLQIQSTAFADLSSQVYEEPSNLLDDSDTRTQQFGIENVFVSGLNTLAISTRYVRYLGASYGTLHEMPLYGAFTRDLFLSDSTSLKATLNGTYLASTGLYPGGRASIKFAASEKTFPFAEINTVAKMPTLVDRYASFDGLFQGNPDLKPERVYAALTGYRYEENHFTLTSTLKGEYRTGIQIPTADETSIMNGGNAYLLSLNEETSETVSPWLDAKGSALFTYSKLNGSGFGYPDLPYATGTLGLRGHLRNLVSLESDARLVGFSAGPSGRAHPAYALFDLVASYHPLQNIRIDAGLDNLFDSAAQAVLDYPLEGRRFFASASAIF